MKCSGVDRNIKSQNYQINCLIWFIVSINARSSQGNMDCPYFVNVPLMIVINIDQYNTKQFRVKSSKRWLQHSSEIIILVQFFSKNINMQTLLTHGTCMWHIYRYIPMEYRFEDCMIQFRCYSYSLQIDLYFLLTYFILKAHKQL